MRAALALGAFLAAAFVTPSHADGCLDTGKLDERVGGCTWNDGRCASAYADATPQIMDDTYIVTACAKSSEGTYVCYWHARIYRCLV